MLSPAQEKASLQILFFFLKLNADRFVRNIHRIKPFLEIRSMNMDNNVSPIYPELFIKNVDTHYYKRNIRDHLDFSQNHDNNLVWNILFINNRHFLPFRRADLTVSALL